MQARTLESVIVPLIDGLRHDTVFGVKLAQEYGPKMKEYFGNRRIPFFDFSDLRSALPHLAIEEDGRPLDPDLNLNNSAKPNAEKADPGSRPG